jgi:hypothetical protein
LPWQNWTDPERGSGDAQADAGSGEDVGRPGGARHRPLRTRFATLVAEMMGSIKATRGCQAKPDVAREFESRFFDMRQALAQHQAKWRSTNIDEDNAGYRRATDELGHKQDEFYNWAKNTLAGL